MVMYFRQENVMKDIELQGQSYNVVQLSACIDQYAKDLMPDEVWEPEILRVPVRVGADGNCLPRCGSIFSFGSEDHHQEIRARIVIEMVENSDIYLDYKFLSQGRDENSEIRAEQLPNHFAMYSDKFMPGSQLSPSKIRSIYEQEVLDICQNSVYMGIWQLFGLASVLGCNVQSVYPNLGNPHVREDLNRLIKPRGTETKERVHILWTTTRTDMLASNWVPNHFVPLLPISKHSDEVLFSDSEEEIDESLSVLEFLQNWEDNRANPDDEGLSTKQYMTEQYDQARDDIMTDQSEIPTGWPDEQMSQTEGQSVLDNPMETSPIADPDSQAYLPDSLDGSRYIPQYDGHVTEPYDQKRDGSDIQTVKPDSPSCGPDLWMNQPVGQPVSDNPMETSSLKHQDSRPYLLESPSSSRYTTSLDDLVAELDQAREDAVTLPIQPESQTGQPNEWTRQYPDQDQTASDNPMDQSDTQLITKARLLMDRRIRSLEFGPNISKNLGVCGSSMMNNISFYFLILFNAWRFHLLATLDLAFIILFQIFYKLKCLV
ncbi:uncharacterized protein LOC128223800 [Mya arenaria]|uniref:uncharacterized protein LOC128223800 n=1 Tax=Mya arenaria TaxID=6604 RepID=UPI0022E93F8A|nr:uncharacterized protein LOC128223800 [Mya arenaria]XP_052789161.1 uncharacterized protein LOC128223800 [Mya arenaria]XP_052789162.1 uncharacterized protein LOC128223800 [Mya arenaria]XP_052789163.1 uncharacterized protein LOC128223800 [Mya arenaria]XP_052789164.1 uncharacterized protein LOC128223800 [Mya arenaria]XP_052789165.1 uncharacterized protein LOC128223800 [Mya arenaria]XP_052789166.1 uncharacterized protein LOC128223800 [Mya arenaria]XP_052789167.1 uncharacterized protein LOC1282